MHADPDTRVIDLEELVQIRSLVGQALTRLHRIESGDGPEVRASVGTPPAEDVPPGGLPVADPLERRESASGGDPELLLRDEVGLPLPAAPSADPSPTGFVYTYPHTSHVRFMPVSWGGPVPQQRAIADADIAELSEAWEVDPCHLRAVLDVESAGSGFLLREPAPARPKILFEAHWFYRLTPLPVSWTRPDLSTRHWNRKLYQGGSREWDRLRDAMGFDPVQALKSASWGLGQVMGFNYAAAGCATIEQFVVECFEGEMQQFNHVLNFIEHNGLMGHLRAGRWAAFARGYNGSGYRANRYDEKLAAAVRKCRG
jgi:hypothetical protein